MEKRGLVVLVVGVALVALLIVAFMPKEAKAVESTTDGGGGGGGGTKLGPDGKHPLCGGPMGITDAAFDALVAHAVRATIPGVTEGGVRIVVGHARVECGAGRALFGNNFLNLRWVSDASTPGACWRKDLDANGKSEDVLFRAYPTALAAAESYLRQWNRRYPLVRDALQSGVAANYVSALTNGTPFTPGGPPARWFTRSPSAMLRDIEAQMKLVSDAAIA